MMKQGNLSSGDSHKTLFLALAILLLTGCQSGVSPEKVAPEAEEADAQKAPIKIAASVARSCDVPRTFTIPGVVSAAPDHSVKVTATISGKLTAVTVVPGQSVSRGQVIAKLNDQHIVEQLDQALAAIETAKANANQSKENLQYAQSSRDRQEHLYKAEVAAGKDLALAENQVQTAAAQVNASQSQIKSAQAARAQIETELQYTKVHSPIAGVVSNRYLNVGDTVDPNTPIIQVVDLKKVVINAGLPADIPDRVHVGERALIRDIAHPDTAYDGKLTVVSPEVDPQSNTIRIQLECINRDGELREGQTVNVAITVGIDRQAVLVPVSALVPNPDNPEAEMIYIVSDGKAKRVAIKKGAVLADQVEILDGVRAGQVVLESEAYGLPDGSPVQIEIKR
jgi:HlyD family secretion protein